MIYLSSFHWGQPVLMKRVKQRFLYHHYLHHHHHRHHHLRHQHHHYLHIIITIITIIIIIIHDHHHQLPEACIGPRSRQWPGLRRRCWNNAQFPNMAMMVVRRRMLMMMRTMTMTMMATMATMMIPGMWGWWGGGGEEEDYYDDDDDEEEDGEAVPGMWFQYLVFRFSQPLKTQNSISAFFKVQIWIILYILYIL